MVANRSKCQCGSDRMLIRPRWFNKFKRPTWVCCAKSCPFRGKRGFRAMKEPVVVGSIYIMRDDAKPVQVIGRNAPYFRVRGPRKCDVPYNYAKPKDLTRAAYAQLQWFAREKLLASWPIDKVTREQETYAR